MRAEQRSALLGLARESVRRALSGAAPPDIPGSLSDLQGVRSAFVTIRGLDGRLRGCMGECPARRPLPECVRWVAVRAALDDPRFDPLRSEDLPAVRFEISVLTDFRPIEPDEVDVGRHGLLVTSPHGAGLLLPQVPVAYGWDRHQFLEALCAKAGLPVSDLSGPDTSLQAFEAEVWEED